MTSSSMEQKGGRSGLLHEDDVPIHMGVPRVLHYVTSVLGRPLSPQPLSPVGWHGAANERRAKRVLTGPGRLGPEWRSGGWRYNQVPQQVLAGTSPEPPISRVASLARQGAGIRCG